MTHRFLVVGPDKAKTTILLAHGAGGAMDTQWMEAITQALSDEGLQVIRFEFDYMASRRTYSKRRPPPRAELLQDEFKAVVSQIGKQRSLVIGGKSMGGRVASMIADELYKQGMIVGLLCLGYPFHPTGKPEKLRTVHLAKLSTPTLICQGTRDPFGSQAEVAGYELSNAIRLNWLDDGDHGFKPRKAISGLTVNDHITTAAQDTATWAGSLSQA
jgi:predicted alpha/beta-hydrolase family hydrolase